MGDDASFIIDIVIDIDIRYCWPIQIKFLEGLQLIFYIVNTRLKSVHMIA